MNGRLIGISAGMTSRPFCGEAFQVTMEVLVRLSLFQRAPKLLREGYQVKVNADASRFREFLGPVEGGDIVLKGKNVFQLADLCKKFGFPGLMARIEEYVRNQSEGGNDGSSWDELDSRNTQDLRERYITKTYDCQSATDKSF